MLIFDATAYRGKPSEPLPGLRPIELIYQSDLWPTADRSAVPTQGTVDKLAIRCAGKLTCLDVECWPTGHAWRKIPDTEARANREKLGRLVDRFHIADPSLRLGYYSLLEGLGGNMAAQLNKIKADDAAMLAPIASAAGQYMLEGVADKVDMLMPSFYVRYENDVPSNQTRCVKTIDRLRQFHKQIYPFVWLQFHDVSKWKGQWLPSDLLGALLTICRDQADGCILWSGTSLWSDVPADLWQMVRDFAGS